MNNIPKYDKNTIEENIKYFQQILLQQKHLSNVIQKNSVTKINKTKTYIKEFEPIVDRHQILLTNIDSQIRTIALNNKNNLQNDTNYLNFLQSKRCLQFNQKIKEIDTTIRQLKLFLNKENIELLPKKSIDKYSQNIN